MFQSICVPDPLSYRRLCICSHPRYDLCPLSGRSSCTCSRPSYDLRSLSCHRLYIYSHSRYVLRFSSPCSLCTYTRSSYDFRTGTLFLSSVSPFHGTIEQISLPTIHPMPHADLPEHLLHRLSFASSSTSLIGVSSLYLYFGTAHFTV